VYAYIPRIIKYYLGEDMILPNVKPIFVMKKRSKIRYENIHNLVVKQTDASGGYGMLIGPKSTKKKFIAKINTILEITLHNL
jgi:uncharacterized circularly permuted ATP-grasp superfamily protein